MALLLSVLVPLIVLCLTHSKEVNVVQDLIVKGEVIARNNIDTRFLLKLPMFKAQSLSLAEELALGDLACPKRFGRFLQVTVHTHTGETEN
jgi:hypothetical protein